MATASETLRIPVFRTDMSTDETILKVEDLKTQFFTEEGVVRAVDGIDFDVRRGEIVGLVG